MLSCCGFTHLFCLRSSIHPPSLLLPPSLLCGCCEQGKSKKSNILDLNKYLDKEIRVKFSGGRERQHTPPHHLTASASVAVGCRKALRLSLQLMGCAGALCCCAVTGVLKGFDPLLNLVLDETKEWLRDPFDPYKITGPTPHLTHPR